MDDLKFYSGDINSQEYQLSIITAFSNDITMKLGEDKCSYLYIKKRRIVDSIEPLTVNGLKITSLKLGDHCTANTLVLRRVSQIMVLYVKKNFRKNT